MEQLELIYRSGGPHHRPVVGVMIEIWSFLMYWKLCDAGCSTRALFRSVKALHAIIVTRKAS